MSRATSVYCTYFNDTGSPSEILLTCPGEPLVLMCIGDQISILKWTIAIPEGNITHSRLVPYMGSRVLKSINETLSDNATVTFSFRRTSEDGTLPLVVTLMIESVYTNINGTKLDCSASNETDPYATYIIHVQGGEPESHLEEGSAPPQPHTKY